MDKFIQLKIYEVKENPNQKDVDEKGLKWIFLGMEEVKVKDSTLIEKRLLRIKSRVKIDKAEWDKEHLLKVDVYNIVEGKYVKTYYQASAVYKKV